MYRSSDNFAEDQDRDMHVVVRGGVYEVDLGEWKCHSIYWPGEGEAACHALYLT